MRTHHLHFQGLQPIYRVRAENIHVSSSVLEREAPKCENETDQALFIDLPAGAGRGKPCWDLQPHLYLMGDIPGNLQDL